MSQSQREMEIWKACDSLVAKGISPEEITCEKIGRQLSDMGLVAGGNTTRIKYRDSWKEAQRRSVGIPNSSLGDSELIHRNTVLIHETIEKQLKAKYEGELQSLKEELLLKSKEFADLHDELAEKELALKSAQDQVEQNQIHQEKLQNQLLEEQKTHAATQEGRLRCEEQLKLMRFDFDRSLAEFKALHQESLQQANERYASLEQQAKIDHQTLRSLADQQQQVLLTQLTQSQEQGLHSQAQAEQLQTELKFKNAQILELNQKLEKAEIQQRNLQKRIEQEVEKQQQFERLLVELETDKKHLEKLRLEDQQIIREQQDNLLSTKEQIGRLRETTLHLTEEVEKLKYTLTQIKNKE